MMEKYAKLPYTGFQRERNYWENRQGVTVWRGRDDTSCCSRLMERKEFV
jgi:hypothetical protein